MFKKISLFGAALVLIAIASWGFYSLMLNARVNDNKIPDTPDTQAIIATLEHAHYLRAVAARTFDVSTFPEVFINTSDFKPNDSQRALIENVFDTETAKSAGYLTYMQAYYLAWKEGASLIQSVEVQDLSPQERDELLRTNQDKIVAPARQDPIGEIKLTYESITVNGDKAVVRYDSPSAYREAILVKVDGKWFVANITIIKVHV